jgi:hypothetical protein
MASSELCDNAESSTAEDKCGLHGAYAEDLMVTEIKHDHVLSGLTYDHIFDLVVDFVHVSIRR